MTTARYYTPNGINIDKIGVSPHVAIPVEEFTEEQLGYLQKLYDDKQIPRFVENNPEPDNAKTETFIRQLIAQGINLEHRILAKLIREEYNRNLNNPPVFDLDFDLALQEAVAILLSGNSQKILNDYLRDNPPPQELSMGQLGTELKTFVSNRGKDN